MHAVHLGGHLPCGWCVWMQGPWSACAVVGSLLSTLGRGSASSGPPLSLHASDLLLVLHRASWRTVMCVQ